MFADAHISSLGNLCFFSLISEEEGEPWDEDAQQKRKSSLRKISSPLAPYRVVTWYMGSGLKAQNMIGIRAQRKGLRDQKNGIRDHDAFEPESGIRFITRSKNLITM